MANIHHRASATPQAEPGHPGGAGGARRSACPAARAGGQAVVVARASRTSPRPSVAASVTVQEGVVSWYGAQFHDRKTASGERFDSGALTMAHPETAFRHDGPRHQPAQRPQRGRPGQRPRAVRRQAHRRPVAGRGIRDRHDAQGRGPGPHRSARRRRSESAPPPGRSSPARPWPSPVRSVTQAIPGAIVATDRDDCVAARAATLHCLRATLLPTFRAGRPIPEQRRRLELITRLTLPARGVRSTPRPAVVASPASSSVPAASARARMRSCTCTAAPIASAHHVTHRSLTSHLARSTVRAASSSRTIAWPRSIPCPAAVDDAIGAYRGLREPGWRQVQLAFVGDSAGGGLALATALKLAGTGRTPACGAGAVLAVGRPGPVRTAAPPPPGEVMISLPWVQECARLYLAGTRCAVTLGVTDPRRPARLAARRWCRLARTNCCCRTRDGCMPRWLPPTCRCSCRSMRGAGTFSRRTQACWPTPIVRWSRPRIPAAALGAG